MKLNGGGGVSNGGVGVRWWVEEIIVCLIYQVLLLNQGGLIRNNIDQ
jgi:hypothetical protein